MRREYGKTQSKTPKFPTKTSRIFRLKKIWTSKSKSKNVADLFHVKRIMNHKFLSPKQSTKLLSLKFWIVENCQFFTGEVDFTSMQRAFQHRMFAKTTLCQWWDIYCIYLVLLQVTSPCCQYESSLWKGLIWVR